MDRTSPQIYQQFLLFPSKPKGLLAPIYIIYRWLPFAISHGKQPLGDWEASTLWMLCCDCFCHHHEEHHHHLHGDESASSGSPGRHGFLISRPIMYLEILKHEGRYRQKRCCVSHTTGVSMLLNKASPLPLSLPCGDSFPTPPPQTPSAHQPLLTEQTLTGENVPVFIITALYMS